MALFQSVQLLGTFDNIPEQSIYCELFLLFATQYCNYFPQKSHDLVSVPD